MTAAPRPRLLTLAWPIFIEQSLRVLTGAVDTFMVSHIADDAVAALGVAHQVVVLCIILFMFVAIGSSVVVTHCLGGGDREGARQIGGTAIAVNTWLGIVASVSIFLFAEPILHFLRMPPALMIYAKPFLMIMGGTVFIEAMNTAMGSILRAHAHSREVMFVSVGQNVVNLAGNCVLLFGLFGAPKMGVAGVALATVISRVAACLALWWMLRRHTQVRVTWRDYFAVSRERLARILHIGLPAAGENLSWWLGFMTVTSFAARLGPQALATQSYVGQITMFVILFCSSIGMANEIVVGHRIGAGEFDEAYHELMKNLRRSLALVAGVACVIALASPWLMAAFTKDEAIVTAGILLLRMGLILEPGRTFNIVVINGLRATGDARFPVLVGLCSMWGIWVPGAYLLSIHFGLGLPGILIAQTIDEWTRGILMYRRWKSKAWLVHATRSRAKVNAPLPA